MKLSDVLKGISCAGVKNGDTEITDIAYDSRKATDGVLFVCLCGVNADGHSFAESAYKNGSRVFLCEKNVLLPDDAQIILCEDTRAALAIASCNFFRNPSEEIAVIGITGTKGKTTTAHIVKGVLEEAGIPTGIIGTIGAGYGNVTLPTVNTTPESYELQKMFRMMLDAGCKAVCMEVSSLGLKFHRTDGISFAVGVFTNLYPDHVGTNEHESFEEYAWWKKQLFPMCKKAIVNIDDEFSNEIIKMCSCPVITYGYNKNADYCLCGVERVKNEHILGVEFSVSRGDEERTFTLSMPGDINAHNALIAIAAADGMGIDSESIRKALKKVFVKGRGEILETGKDFTVIIDYAHNGASLRSIIETVSEYEHNRIIALYGSVGGRTEIRRRELGLVSGALCDLTIITSDDPDFEDPENIIADIAAAVEEAGGKYVSFADREKAIEYAITHADKGDIIVLAGKGHEEFMKIKGKKEPFSEKEIVLRLMGKI